MSHYKAKQAICHYGKRPATHSRLIQAWNDSRQALSLPDLIWLGTIHQRASFSMKGTAPAAIPRPPAPSCPTPGTVTNCQ